MNYKIGDNVKITGTLTTEILKAEPDSMPELKKETVTRTLTKVSDAIASRGVIPGRNEEWTDEFAEGEIKGHYFYTPETDTFHAFHMNPQHVGTLVDIKLATEE